MPGGAAARGGGGAAAQFEARSVVELAAHVEEALSLAARTGGDAIAVLDDAALNDLLNVAGLTQGLGELSVCFNPSAPPNFLCAVSLLAPEAVARRNLRLNCWPAALTSTFVRPRSSFIAIPM